jgi:hypothetical protein
MNAAIETKKDEYIALNDERLELINKISRSKSDSDKASLQEKKKAHDLKMTEISSQITAMS